MNIHTGNIDKYVKGSNYTGDYHMSDQNTTGTYFGKPLYERMFEINNLNKGEATIIRALPTNYRIISIDAIFTDNDGNYFPISYFDNVTEFNVYVTDNKLTYVVKTPRDIDDVKVFLRYYIEEDEE